MRPFELSKSGLALKESFLQADTLRTISSNLEHYEIKGIIYQWITEGIPYAFKENPLLYEAIRGWIGRRLNINPKELTLIGSARTGYSLSPPPEFGKSFGPHSDLDFLVVSETLFNDCRNTFEKWKIDYKLRRVLPKTSVEEEYWKSNLKVVTNTIQRGFIDSNKIPNIYPMSQKISQSMWILKEKLKITSFSPQIRKASIRVYTNWDSCIRQIELNFNHTLSFI